MVNDYKKYNNCEGGLVVRHRSEVHVISVMPMIRYQQILVKRNSKTEVLTDRCLSARQTMARETLLAPTHRRIYTAYKT